MPRLIQSLPKLRTHKASGRAMVTLDGQDIYLGPAGSLIARNQYDRIVSEWLANGRALPNPSARSISEIIARFWNTLKSTTTIPTVCRHRKSITIAKHWIRCAISTGIWMLSSLGRCRSEQSAMR